MTGAINRLSAGLGSIITDIVAIAKSKDKWEAIAGIINLVVDLLYFAVDPRLRVGQAGGQLADDGQFLRFPEPPFQF